MSRFIVRVQLDGKPPEELYDRLHDAMRERGFVRCVASGDKYLRLPHAEYALESDSTLEEIMVIARDVAATVQDGFKLMGCKTSEVLFYGLEEIEREEC